MRHHLRRDLTLIIMEMLEMGLKKRRIRELLNITHYQYQHCFKTNRKEINEHKKLHKLRKRENLKEKTIGIEEKYKNRIQELLNKNNQLFSVVGPLKYLAKRILAFQKKTFYDKKFTTSDVVDKFGHNPVCPLSGRKIDYNDPSTYELDHVIPCAQGGSSSLDNLQLLNPIINRMKFTLTNEEFIETCKLISKNAEIAFPTRLEKLN